ncbi:hypothetical protein WMW72_20300 [Paenibacillus filicis]|uniref:Uncharacterized protein n=1 Tax=Paenibacillus filicis TaxID=669464 RepID=A0ABU9DN07_9BACL
MPEKRETGYLNDLKEVVATRTLQSGDYPIILSLEKDGEFHPVIVGSEKMHLKPHFKKVQPLRWGARTLINNNDNDDNLPLFVKRVPVERAAALSEQASRSNVHLELEAIQKYITEESLRIDKNYKGETQEYLRNMLAHSVGHMVMNLDYEELSLKTLNRLFGQFGMTFEEVKEAIRRDIDCNDRQDW